MTGATNGEKSFDVGDNLDQSGEVQGVVDEFGPADLSFTGDTSAALPWSTQGTTGHIVDFLGQHLK
ncbi:hypothetical protein [Streptomyces sp. cg40]|uniref:hypothetical protein n=1 Tax=Streptomyces sp. cg40 TaxID=3419764 RepID=UPI003D030A61